MGRGGEASTPWALNLILNGPVHLKTLKTVAKLDFPRKTSQSLCSKEKNKKQKRERFVFKKKKKKEVRRKCVRLLKGSVVYPCGLW